MYFRCISNIDGDIPSFSHPFFVEKYGHEAKLNWQYYLTHGRPATAYAVLLQNENTDKPENIKSHR